MIASCRSVHRREEINRIGPMIAELGKSTTCTRIPATSRQIPEQTIVPAEIPAGMR